MSDPSNKADNRYAPRTRKLDAIAVKEEGVMIFVEMCDLVEKVRRDFSDLVQKHGPCAEVTGSIGSLIDSAGALNDTVAKLTRELRATQDEGVKWEQRNQQIRLEIQGG